MTAIDVTMSKDLVATLNDESFSNSATATYARDVKLNLEAISDPAIYVDGTVAHQRQARDYWTRSVTLTVIAVAPQEQRGDSGAAAVENEKDAWLAFIDNEVIGAIKSAKLSGKRAESIEFEQRLDADKVREQSIFYTKFTVNFALV